MNNMYLTLAKNDTNNSKRYLLTMVHIIYRDDDIHVYLNISLYALYNFHHCIKRDPQKDGAQ